MKQSLTLNQPVTLADPLGQGGEATVYNVAHQPNMVAKLYHKPLPEQAAKLRAMLLNPPEQPQTHIALAWPTALLYRQHGRLRAVTTVDEILSADGFVGFLMPKIMGRHAIFHIYNPAMRQQLPYPVDLNFLYRTAANLAVIVSALHTKGHVIGDINESNILVNRQALVTLIDCDSFQVTDEMGHIHRCPVGKPEFTPPELQGVSFKMVDQQPAHDLFGLGVLLFQLLMEGYHPFAGVLQSQQSVGRVDLYAIRQGWFPYGNEPSISPPPAAPQFAWLHPEVQQLFLMCFRFGHHTPTARPNGLDWQPVLRLSQKTLTVCAEARHRYSSHLSSCPYCEGIQDESSKLIDKQIYAHQLPEFMAQTARRYKQLNQEKMLRAYQDKNNQKAIEYAHQLLQYNRQNALAYFILGVSYSREGEYDRAINSLTTAIYRGYSPVSEAYYRRALIYEKKRLYQKALADVAEQLQAEQLQIKKDVGRLAKGQALQEKLHQLVERQAAMKLWRKATVLFIGIGVLPIFLVVLYFDTASAFFILFLAMASYLWFGFKYTVN